MNMYLTIIRDFEHGGADCKVIVYCRAAFLVAANFTMPSANLTLGESALA